MANTLIPIQTYTLTSTASSVTFSNIPQNYTDLKLVISARGTATNTNKVSDISLRINNDSGAYYSYRGLTGIPATSSTSSFSFSNSTIFTYIGFGTSSDATANTFGNTELYFPNYTSTNAKSVSVDTVGEDNSTAPIMRLNAGVWNPASQAAISTLALSLVSGNFDVGSTFTLYGISNGVKATGGTLTVTGGYAYHTFTSTGSFLPNQQIKGAQVLCIAGGGSGGTRHAGGGGAGGISYHASKTIPINSYTVLVGSGGASVSASGTGYPGNNGNNSVFMDIISNGGGQGGQGNTAAAGGSGGGGGPAVTGTTNQGNTGGATGYGNNGGAGYTNNSSIYRGGGGGGAGAVGGAANSGAAGTGGNGTTNWTDWHGITGTGVLSSGLYYIAAGGGGSSYFDGTSANGGIGGGGAGGGNGGTAGTANTGSGGGADGLNTGSASGAGGSGLVIIRYPLS